MGHARYNGRTPCNDVNLDDTGATETLIRTLASLLSTASKLPTGSRRGIVQSEIGLRIDSAVVVSAIVDINGRLTARPFLTDCLMWSDALANEYPQANICQS